MNLTKVEILFTFAVFHQDAAICELLLQVKADPLALDSMKRTAIDLAIKKHQRKILSLLLAHHLPPDIEIDLSEIPQDRNSSTSSEVDLLLKANQTVTNIEEKLKDFMRLWGLSRRF